MAAVSERPALSITDLAFAHPGGWRLAVPTLRLEPSGELLLAGASGSGKSTLLQLIAGLLEPVSGRIEIAGEDIAARRGAARDRLRGRQVGMIFQTFNLLAGFSAIENVMLAMLFADRPRSSHRPRGEELLRSLGIEELDRPVDRLSVGQQQRVAVARALAASPKLVLADEPTASLDPENASKVVELIRSSCREHGAALLLTSHDPTLRRSFERVVEVGEFVNAGGTRR